MLHATITTDVAKPKLDDAYFVEYERKDARDRRAALKIPNLTAGVRAAAETAITAFEAADKLDAVHRELDAAALANKKDEALKRRRERAEDRWHRALDTARSATMAILSVPTQPGPEMAAKFDACLRLLHTVYTNPYHRGRYSIARGVEALPEEDAAALLKVALRAIAATPAPATPLGGPTSSTLAREPVSEVDVDEPTELEKLADEWHDLEARLVALDERLDEISDTLPPLPEALYRRENEMFSSVRAKAGEPLTDAEIERWRELPTQPLYLTPERARLIRARGEEIVEAKAAYDAACEKHRSERGAPAMYDEMADLSDRQTAIENRSMELRATTGTELAFKVALVERYEHFETGEFGLRLLKSLLGDVQFLGNIDRVRRRWISARAAHLNQAAADSNEVVTPHLIAAE